MGEKVYVSKSNMSSSGLYNKTCIELSYYNVEVVSYNGGTYSHKAMLDCDVVLFIPPENSIQGDICTIGRGQYEQLFAISDSDTINFYLVKKIDTLSNKIIISNIWVSDLVVINKDWKSNYASFKISEEYELDELEFDLKFAPFDPLNIEELFFPSINSTENNFDILTVPMLAVSLKLKRC